MDFSPDAESAGGWKDKFEVWFVRNYGTPAELEKYGFQKRGLFSFNVVEIGLTLIISYIFYSIYF